MGSAKTALDAWTQISGHLDVHQHPDNGATDIEGLPYHGMVTQEPL